MKEIIYYGDAQGIYKKTNLKLFFLTLDEKLETIAEVDNITTGDSRGEYYSHRYNVDIRLNCKEKNRENDMNGLLSILTLRGAEEMIAEIKCRIREYEATVIT